MDTLYEENKTLYENKKNYSKEVVALFVFIGMYICVRFAESFVIPKIPSCITREVSSLFRLGPILVTIIFGITYMSKRKKSNHTIPDIVLQERMTSWMK